MTSKLSLRVRFRQAGEHQGVPVLLRCIEVLDSDGNFVDQFHLMCGAIEGDIQHPEGSGAQALEEIRRIDSGAAEYIEADGNAWVTHITREKVWFEGLYSQGEGGEVSFAQYKLAVETYVRSLSNLDEKLIVIDFPEH